MEKTNLLTLVVTLTVGIILAGSLLMPVITDATTTERTFTNSGFYTMDEITDDTDITIAWDHTKPKILTVGTEEVDLSLVPTNTITSVIMSDKMIVRYAPITNNTLLQVYSSAGYVGASVTDGTDATITIQNMTIEATIGENVVSKTVTDGYFATNGGDHVLKKPTSDAYVHKSDSIIVLGGNTTIGSYTVGIFGSGNITDGVDLEFVPLNNLSYDVTFGDITYDYTDETGYIDLVKLTDLKFDVTVEGTTGTATYSYFLVPVEVTAEMAQHLNPGEIALINALPILIIIGLVLAGVGAIFIRNRD